MTQQLALAKLLISRLERLSADSFWAHQASGLRGSLLRAMEPGSQVEHGELMALVDRAFDVLEKGARDHFPTTNTP